MPTKKPSWKTSVGGALGAIGTTLSGFSSDDVLKGIGVIASGIGILLLGLAARDNNVSSEQAGAKP